MNDSETLTKQLVVRVSDELFDLLNSRALKEDRSQAYIVREILWQYFERSREDDEPE